MTLNLDIIIVTGFLIVNLIFGILSGRGIKTSKNILLVTEIFPQQLLLRLGLVALILA
jgi:hypothetical protein